METSLEQIIYGIAADDNTTSENGQIIAYSSGLEDADASLLHAHVPLEPPVDDGTGSDEHALAIVAAQELSHLGRELEMYIMARAWRSDDSSRDLYQYVLVPNDVLYSMGGDIQPLVRLVAAAPDLPDEEPGTIEALPLPAPATATRSRRITLLRVLLEQTCKGDFELMMGLLAGTLSSRRLAIRGFEGTLNTRLMLVQGLMMLLPSPARPYITFSTHSERMPDSDPAIIFVSESAPLNGRVQLNWANPEINPALLEHPYIRHLLDLWSGSLESFVENLHHLDPIAFQMMHDTELSPGLEAVAQRHMLDTAVRNDDSLVLADLLNTMRGPAAPQGEMKHLYMERILYLALDERDTDAMLFVARQMDSDPELEESLRDDYEAMLNSQPDALYLLCRQRLAEGISEQWLERLHAAARRSLRVAIDDGDPATLASWIQLVAREPAQYELGPVLREGLVAASKRAITDSDLARLLVTQAIKRDPDTLRRLLDDEELRTALPDHLSAAFEMPDTETIESLAGQSREFFLLAMARAADRDTPVISSTAIRTLWDIRTNYSNIVLGAPFRPLNIVRRIVTDGADSLMPGALETLLTLLLASNDDETLMAIALPLAEQDVLLPALIPALQQSGRSVDDLTGIVTRLLGEQVLSAQDTVNIYSALLNERDWEDGARTLVAQIARLVNQFPDVNASNAVLWKILDLASETRNDLIARAATRRLLADLADAPVETQLVDTAQRLRKATAWNELVQSTVLRWWREFVTRQPLGQLQKIDRALEGRRGVEDLRTVAQTALALRRALGTRSMAELAESVDIAYRFLQAIADAFDPPGRTAGSFDTTTLRMAIDLREDDLSPDQRHVLATNLKELSQLITTLADHRSKPSLIGSDDAVERKIISGEQSPQSGVDILKWLSGHLDGGAHSDAEDA